MTLTDVYVETRSENRMVDRECRLTKEVIQKDSKLIVRFDDTVIYNTTKLALNRPQCQ